MILLVIRLMAYSWIHVPTPPPLDPEIGVTTDSDGGW